MAPLRSDVGECCLLAAEDCRNLPDVGEASVGVGFSYLFGGDIIDSTIWQYLDLFGTIWYYLALSGTI